MELDPKTFMNQAITILKEAVKLEPSNASSWLILSQIYASIGEVGNALTTLNSYIFHFIIDVHFFNHLVTKPCMNLFHIH